MLILYIKSYMWQHLTKILQNIKVSIVENRFYLNDIILLGLLIFAYSKKNLSKEEADAISKITNKLFPKK
jgi:hypothetical protein